MAATCYQQEREGEGQGGGGEGAEDVCGVSSRLVWGGFVFYHCFTLTSGDRQSGNHRSKAFVCLGGLSRVRGCIHTYLIHSSINSICACARLVYLQPFFPSSFFRLLYLPIADYLLIRSPVGWAVYWSQVGGLASG